MPSSRVHFFSLPAAGSDYVAGQGKSLAAKLSFSQVGTALTSAVGSPETRKGGRQQVRGAGRVQMG